MLRILGWPQLHVRDLSGCSTFNVMFDQCKRLHELYDFHSYIFTGKDVLSRDKPSWWTMTDRFFKCPGITWIDEGPEKILKYKPMVSTEAMRYFHPETTTIPYDLVWTMDMCISYWFNFCLTKRDGAWFLPIDVPVVAEVNECLDEAGIPQFKPGQITGRLCTLNSLMCAQGKYVTTEEQWTLLAQISREFLSPAKAAFLMSEIRRFVTPTNLQPIIERFDEFEEQRKKRLETGKWTVFHQGTFEGKRHLPKVCKALDHLETVAPGKYQFLNLSQVRDGKLTTSQMPTTLRLGQSREQFHSALDEGDILLVTADRIITGVGYAEAIMSGMIPLFTPTEWIKERLPEGYPYVCEIEQFSAAIKHMTAHWETAKKWGGKLREIWKQWDTDEAVHPFRNYLEGIADTNRKKCVAQLRKSPGGAIVCTAIDNLPDKVRGFTELREMAKASPIRYTPIAFRWMMLEQGFKDMGSDPPVFQRG